MKKFKVLEKMNQIPGGMLIIPMLTSALLFTLFPNFMGIGSPTEDLFTYKSTMALLGLILFFSGTQLELQDVPAVLKKSSILIASKLIIALGLSLLALKLSNNELFFGLQTISLVAILFSVNPGFFLATIDQTLRVDMGVFALLNIFALPTIPLMILSSSSGSGFNWAAILSTFLPFLIGIAFTAIDLDFKKYFMSGPKVIMPFLGFALGAKLNLINAFNQFIPGLIGTILFYLLLVFPMILIERKTLKNDGVSSLSMGTVAGVAVSVPLLMGQLTNQDQIVAQISIAVILTSLLTPFLMNLYKNIK